MTFIRRAFLPGLYLSKLQILIAACIFIMIL